MNNGKVRIYELSKELNLENKDIKEICEQLNIAVKSHSSTVTASQAERVKAVAAKSPRAEKANSPKQELQPPKASGKRKQQILAIHHKTDTSNAPTQPKRPSLGASPKLVSPPSRPKSTAARISQEESSIQAKATQKPEFSAAESEVTPTVSKEQKASEQMSKPAMVKPPKLSSPPSRPQKTKSVAKKSSIPAPIKPKIRSSEQSPSKLEGREETETEKKKKVIPSLPKLNQRPQKAQVVGKVGKISKEEVDENETEDLVDDEIDTDDVISKTEVKKVTRLKRPTPPRKVKEWENEEEDEGKLSKAKKAAKKRRAPKPVLDDDDDFDADSTTVQIDTAFSLSTARPPKPQSMQQQQPAASSHKKPRKPSFKTEKTQKTERQTKGKVAPTLPEFITLTDNLTVRDLAQRLNTPETDIIRSLFFKGIPVNITQTLDLETAKMVAEELEVIVETPEETSAAVKETEMLDADDLENLQLRPPVVTIMGHVDHGKTTLLDSIRKSTVASGEAGGITQHIGAYHVDVEHAGKQQQIVFLDTPGHEAFTAMRARGTRVTDIAILVVAADDGVQPQTKEAISHAKAAQVPLIVAINKVDKPDSNPDRIKQELTEQGLVPEDWGGDTTMVNVSALKGDNLDELLEMILLVAEVEELSANPNRPAKGTVIEANLDRNRGPVATLLVQNGTLRVGDSIVAGSVLGKVRAMVDDMGEKVEEATPSFAVEILGLNDVPEAGDEFDIYPSEREARVVADQRAIEQRDTRLLQSLSSRRISLSTISAQAQEGELKELNLIIKADVQGSVEAILGSLAQLPQNEVQIRTLLASPGEVTETDVDLAAASGAVIIGFNTTLASGARQAADREGVDIRQYNIIYKLLDEIQGAMEGLLDPEEVQEDLGQVEVRAVFPVGRGAVAGCYVLSGKIVRNCKIRVRRGNKIVHEGDLNSLKRMKDDVKEVNTGFECGIGASKFSDWKEGDIIEAYELVFKRRTLATS
ncbi:translation initiation factor IF-2 [Waterburya agarophytonicola K14]|uniref:Translation initiation factor IF-2 n=1 Tax=Waterburya agarophytonicola KI4 TaxID=2874699 RepID=A0A964FG52_9CYAN|nr:translation initiation factor IF-2 [Waterburya agarophytonicola]MCC0177792.1 translation initiation factor IF-2 [Waterburya agarophytonicola KI4]